MQLHLTRDELVEQFEKASEETKKDRGVDRIATFKADEYEILENDRVKFKGVVGEATVPLVGMYILEKLKQL